MAFFREDVYAPVATPNQFETKKFELRSSRVITECTCIKKNGLQGECFRAECIKKNAGDAGINKTTAKEPSQQAPTPQMHGDPGTPMQNAQQQPLQEPLQPVVQNNPAPQNNNLQSGSKAHMHTFYSASKSQMLHHHHQHDAQNQDPAQTAQAAHHHTEIHNSGHNHMTHTQNYQNSAPVNNDSSTEQNPQQTIQSNAQQIHQPPPNIPQQPPQEVAPAAVPQQQADTQHVQQQAPNNQQINSNAPFEVHEECIDPIQCEMLSPQTLSVKRNCGLTDTPPNELIEYPHQTHQKPIIDENFTQRFQDS